jgi:hypothetical protein
VSQKVRRRLRRGGEEEVEAEETRHGQPARLVEREREWGGRATVGRIKEKKI